ncbi:MAG TPA: hypothetical protein VGD08_13640 [Stellaceae bacterium]
MTQRSGVLLRSSIGIGGRVLPVTVEFTEGGGYSATYAAMGSGAATATALTGLGTTYEAALLDLRNRILAHRNGLDA